MLYSDVIRQRDNAHLNIITYVRNTICVINTGKQKSELVSINTLYTNIDQKLRNKLHETMHCKTGVICLFDGNEIYSLL